MLRGNFAHSSLAVPDRSNIAERNGYFRELEMLIRRLDQAGLLSADDFATELEDEAGAIETGWAGAYAPGTPRDDVQLLLSLASGIKREYALRVQFGEGVGADISPPSNSED